MNVDPAKLEVFMGKMIGHMTGSTLCCSIWLGDELGLYRELAGTGPRNADSVAAKTGCNARLVREWLDAQASGGLVAYDPAADTYELSPEAAGPGRRRLARFRGPGDERHRLDVPGRAEGGRSLPGQRGVGLGRAPPVPVLRDRVVLQDWIPGLPHHAVDPGARRGETKLRAGARVADVGCGHGASAWRWPPPTRTRRSVGSTSTPCRSRRPAGGRSRRGCAGGPGLRWRPRPATPGCST